MVRAFATAANQQAMCSKSVSGSVKEDRADHGFDGRWGAGGTAGRGRDSRNWLRTWKRLVGQFRLEITSESGAGSTREEGKALWRHGQMRTKSAAAGL